MPMKYMYELTANVHSRKPWTTLHSKSKLRDMRRNLFECLCTVTCVRFVLQLPGLVWPKYIGYFNPDWSNRHVVCTCSLIVHWLLVPLRGFGLTWPSAPAHTTCWIGLYFCVGFANSCVSVSTFSYSILIPIIIVIVSTRGRNGPSEINKLSQEWEVCQGVFRRGLYGFKAPQSECLPRTIGLKLLENTTKLNANLPKP